MANSFGILLYSVRRNAKPYHKDGRNLQAVVPAHRGVYRRIVESGLLKSIDDESRRETSPQKCLERTVEQVVRLRLSYDSNRPLRGQTFVPFDSDTEADRNVTVIIIPLREQRGSLAIKAGMRNGKNEAAVGLEGPPHSTQHRRDGGDVHQAHIADC